MKHFDAIVLGCGAMGSAALWRLARRGIRCCGIEQYGVAHDLGSSHGESRAIRKAYFEHPDYIPILDRAYALWDELQAASNMLLKHDVGMVFAGAPESDAIRGLERTYAKHRLAHDRLTATEATARFPTFHFRDNHVVFHDPHGGYVEPEKAVAACLGLARQAGATILTHRRVDAWHADAQGVAVYVGAETIRAAKLVITAGAWAGRVLGSLAIPLRVVRKPLVWYTSPDIGRYAHAFPVWFMDMPYGAVYGFPAHNGREMKVAVHSGGSEVARPEELDRSYHPQDDMAILQCLRETFPTLEPVRTRHAVCMYTNTPDTHFVLDRHPQHSNVAIAAGFSGHGFKFMPAIGEIMADLAEHGDTQMPIDFLRLARFQR